MTATMRAALLVGQGGPEMVEVRDDVAVPVPAEGETADWAGAAWKKED